MTDYHKLMEGTSKTILEKLDEDIEKLRETIKELKKEYDKK